MSKTLLDLLEEKNKKFDNFLTGVKKVNEIVPFVQQAKEETEWSLGVFKNIPQEATEKMDLDRLENVFTQDLRIWGKALPEVKIDSHYLTTSGSGASGTASQIVFSEILSVDANGMRTPDVDNWSQHYLDQYNQMQVRRSRNDEVKDLLKKLHHPLADEFVDAQSMFTKADSGVISPKEAANSMRNVLNHFEGNLLEKARIQPKENVKRSQQWQFISNRLATGGIGSSEHALLLAKATDQNNITIELTVITKNTAVNPLPRLRIVHTQWLDHLYNSLKLINLPT